MNPTRRISGRIGLSSLLLNLALGAGALSVLGLAGCDHTRAPEQRAAAEAASSQAVKVVGAQRVLKDTPFERTWDLNLKKPVANAWILPELSDTVFFQMKDSNEIVAVDALSGHTRWVSIALPEACKLPPGAAHVRLPSDRNDVAIFDDRLYVVSQDILYTFDVGSGQLIWRYVLPFSPSSSPKPVGVDSGLRVFIGDWAGRLQVVSFEMTKAFPYVVWQYNTGTTVTAPPIEREELVYVNDSAGLVHAFKLDRQQVWSFKAGGRIDGASAIRDRVLFVGTSDRILYAINRLTGEKLGQVNLNAPISRAPLAFTGDADRVYTWVAPDQGDRGGLYAFTAQSDTVAFSDVSRHPMEVVRMGPAWHLPAVDRMVCSTPGHFYLTAGNSMVVQAVDRSSGVVEWTWDVAAERTAEQQAAGVRDISPLSQLIQYVDPTEQNRSIFAVDANGVVVAYRFFGYVPVDATMTKAEAPAPEKVPEKKPKDAAPAPAP